MKFRITKSKIGVMLLSGAAVITLGTVSTFAANKPIDTVQAKIQNGVKTYSTDGGQTWTEETPEDMIVTEENGELRISNGNPDKAPDKGGMLSMVKDGVKMYSTDGGETWTEGTPDGVTVIEEEGEDGGNKIIMKHNNEN